MNARVSERICIGASIDFDTDIDSSFSVTFLPLDLFDHWERGSMLANFVADYYRHNFPQEDVHNLVSTVLNELIENSAKFSKNNSTPVQLTARKRRNSIMVRLENCIPEHRKDRFVAVCRELFDRDLDELYVERIRSNLNDSTTSGIGLLLIRKDYGTAISFELISEERGPTRVAVTAELDFDVQRRGHR